MKKDSIAAFGDYDPSEEDLEDDNQGDPDEPQDTRLLRMIEHNTSVLRAWTRFFGAVWLIAFFFYIVAVLGECGKREAYERTWMPPPELVR